jgi:hypothetical protein
MMRWPIGGLLLAAALLAGCDDGGGASSLDTDVYGDDMPDDFPAGSCRGTTGSGTDGCDTDGTTTGEAAASTSTPAEACLAEGCTGQGVCAATWDVETEQRGPFECRFTCIPLLDETSWCSNDASCCDATARCTGRGYCVLDEDDASSGSSSTGAGSSSTGTGA